jgi:hypothetical protein
MFLPSSMQISKLHYLGKQLKKKILFKSEKIKTNKELQHFILNLELFGAFS